MPRYFFEINGQRDQVGVEFETDEAAKMSAQETLAWLAEHDKPSLEYGDEWVCVVRNETNHRIDCITRKTGIKGQQAGQGHRAEQR